MYLSLIIPAYNEEKRLSKTLISVNDYLSHQSYDYEIIVIDDGSKDETVQLVSSLEKEIPYLKLLIQNDMNRGKGYAVRAGMLSAVGNYRLFMDADGSTSIDQIEKLRPFFLEGYDVVISSRRVSGAVIKAEQPWYRLFLGWIFRTIVEFIVPLGVKDSQNGFKMFSNKAAMDIFSQQTVFGWAFDVEILHLARKLNYRIKEIPVVWTDNDQSKVTFKGMFNMLREVLKVRFHKY
ncbi:MAG: dolichyl-phosphate beta-glucosyltransferase [Candidatus Paceibacterota bacterium]|jgi:dolichyl-phosphate beta-glucosyltransferase